MTKRMIVIININIQQAITMINFQEHKYWLGFHRQTNRPSFFLHLHVSNVQAKHSRKWCCRWSMTYTFAILLKSRVQLVISVGVELNSSWSIPSMLVRTMGVWIIWSSPKDRDDGWSWYGQSRMKTQKISHCLEYHDGIIWYRRTKRVCNYWQLCFRDLIICISKINLCMEVVVRFEFCICVCFIKSFLQNRIICQYRHIYS